jgi:hypothetical protein
MKADFPEVSNRPYDPEFSRLKLLNLTLQSENDILREELEAAKLANREFREESPTHRMPSPSRQADPDFSSVDVLDAKYRRLEAENRLLRNETARATPTRLKPVKDDQSNDEVDHLKGEIKSLRETLDKLSRSFTSPSKSKSPSPTKIRLEESQSNQKQTLHNLYYDRTTDEAAGVLERHQAMYARLTG